MSAIPKRLKRRYDVENTSIKPENEYRPKTKLGERLMALRSAYIAAGGVLLDDAAFEAELRARRGGLNG